MKVCEFAASAKSNSERMGVGILEKNVNMKWRLGGEGHRM